jgi:hypothetical protein
VEKGSTISPELVSRYEYYVVLISDIATQRKLGKLTQATQRYTAPIADEVCAVTDEWSDGRAFAVLLSWTMH